MAYRSSFVEINVGDKLGEGYFNGIYHNLFSAGNSVVWAPPIGTIVPWLKSFTGVPQTLPSGWMECDGSTINDSESPLDGETLIDLNGENYFLYGNSTSGTVKTEDFLPTHAHNLAATNSHGASTDFADTNHNSGVASSGFILGTTAGTAWKAYSVVWIIRFK